MRPLLLSVAPEQSSLPPIFARMNATAPVALNPPLRMASPLISACEAVRAVRASSLSVALEQSSEPSIFVPSSHTVPVSLLETRRMSLVRIPSARSPGSLQSTSQRTGRSARAKVWYRIERCRLKLQRMRNIGVREVERLDDMRTLNPNPARVDVLGFCVDAQASDQVGRDDPLLGDEAAEVDQFPGGRFSKDSLFSRCGYDLDHRYKTARTTWTARAQGHYIVLDLGGFTLSTEDGQLCREGQKRGHSRAREGTRT